MVSRGSKAMRSQIENRISAVDEDFVDVDAIFHAITDDNLLKLKGLMAKAPADLQQSPCLHLGRCVWTPIGLAAAYNHLGIIRWLLSYEGGADVNIQDADGSTPLINACQENFTKAVKELLHCKAQVNTVNDQGMTAVHVACKGGYHALVKTLLAQHADVHIPDKQKQTPLMSAVVAGNKPCIKALLEGPLRTGGTDAQDAQGQTALMLAVERGSADVAKLLLEHGVDSDKTNNKGMTPLMVAASNGDAKLARLLLKHNPDTIRLSGPKGMAIDIALRGGHKAVATAIRQGLSRRWPLTGLAGLPKVVKVSKPKKARVKTARGMGILQEDGEVWVMGVGTYKPNGDFYEDIPYFL